MTMRTRRNTPIDIGKEEFRAMGYELIDQIAGFVDGIHSKPVTTGATPKALQKTLGGGTLPEKGIAAPELLSKATELLLDNSLLNGHPKFMGFITSSAAPIGALADLLVAAVNPNVGAQVLGPMATEIEKQTIGWLAELVGLPTSYGGVLVSGGNMANFTAFLAARTAKEPRNVKKDGISNSTSKMIVYCSETTHTWVEKAAILFGLGTDAIRWVASDDQRRMDLSILDRTIKEDIQGGCTPLMVIGTAGDVSTGAVDDLRGIATICQAHDLWFHIDGAYGVPAVSVPRTKGLFDGMREADSIALDPHKWLYSPLEAGCALVKNPQHLIDTFSSHPEYYNFAKNEEGTSTNFYEYGMQNSRGFRALKVWLALQQVGRSGYVKMIDQDMQLSELLFELARSHPELEAISQNLSITNMRFVPQTDLPDTDREQYLNELNEAIVNELQQGGEVFLSNAVVKGKYCLRSCIVNFRTTQQDIEETIEIIVRIGQQAHRDLRSK